MCGREIECPECGGTGYVEVQRSVTLFEEMPCPDCRGWGQIEGTEKNDD